MSPEEALEKLQVFTESILSSSYYLEGKVPKRGQTLEHAKQYMEHPELKIVGRTVVDDCVVSTVFLERDHNWGMGPPILFETMVFKGDLHDSYCDRYVTWEEAEKGHEEVVEKVKEGRLYEETE
jgi:hypothetical protein